MDHRRGFTLVEVIVAGVIVSFVLGTIGLSLSNLSKAKASSTSRLVAHLRADAALSAIRQDIASVIRSDDLFYSRLVLYDDVRQSNGPLRELDRDELLIYTNGLRPVANLDYDGEGQEYETQYRIESDEWGDVLWSRQDPMPDRYEFAGGLATPIVEGILSMNIEAYDGQEWHNEWDSDEQGIPFAVRVTLAASGYRNPDDIGISPIAHVRTVVAIDRVLPPADLFRVLPGEEPPLPDLAPIAGDGEGEVDGPGRTFDGDGLNNPGRGGGRGGGGRGGGGRGGGGGDGGGGRGGGGGGRGGGGGTGGGGTGGGGTGGGGTGNGGGGRTGPPPGTGSGNSNGNGIDQ